MIKCILKPQRKKKNKTKSKKQKRYQASLKTTKTYTKQK